MLCTTVVALTAQFHAARDTSQALYKEVPTPWVFDDLAPGEVPECETALTTLPALGTAKDRLTTAQLADWERRQAEVSAKREAAAELTSKQALQQAERSTEIKEKKEKEERRAKDATLASARHRLRVIEARKQQRAAQEQEVLLQQKKAAKAAEDAAR